MRFISPALALAACLLASPAFAAKIALTDPALPPDLSSGEVPLTIVISNITTEQHEKLNADTNLIDNLEVVMPLIDTGALPYTDEKATDALPFYLQSDSDVQRESSGDTWTYTILATIKDAIGGKLDEKYDNSMVLEISFKDAAGDELGEESFTLNREIFAVDAQPNFKETAIEGTHSQLRVYWQHEAAAAAKPSGTKTPRRMNVYVVESDLLPSATLNAKKFDATNGATTDVVTCSYQDPGADRGACIVCDPDVYLDFAAISAANIPGLKVKRADSKAETVTVGGLDNDKQYVVFMQWEPSGLKASECVVGQPSPNLSLTELNGEEEAHVTDFRCFIATAAYGSPLHADLAVFRWFRDEVLMPTLPGRLLVETYYAVSPPLADFIAAHPALRDATRDVLEHVASWIRGPSSAEESR